MHLLCTHTYMYVYKYTYLHMCVYACVGILYMHKFMRSKCNQFPKMCHILKGIYKCFGKSINSVRK